MFGTIMRLPYFSGWSQMSRLSWWGDEHHEQDVYGNPNCQRMAAKSARSDHPHVARIVGWPTRKRPSNQFPVLRTNNSRSLSPGNVEKAPLFAAL